MTEWVLFYFCWELASSSSSNLYGSDRPLIDTMLWNRYVYVGDNPVNYIDLTGRGFWGDLWDKVTCAGGVIADLVGGMSRWSSSGISTKRSLVLTSLPQISTASRIAPSTGRE